MYAMQAITIFSDGSSLGNPGPGGWGTIVTHGNTVTELGGHEVKTTNNRMEMTAVIRGLAFLAEQKVDGKIIVNTDSQYLINGITKWVHGWQASGWMTKNKMPVLNKDLWQTLLAATEDREIDWRYVEGHAGIPGNERVDSIATSFAAGNDTELFSGPLTEYDIDLKQLAPAYDPSVRGSSGKAYSYISMVDGAIERHVTWAECEARVKGKAAKFKKVFSKAEEEALTRSWLNAR